MKTSLSHKIIESMVATGVVPSEDKELYQYGLRQGLIMIVNVLSAILIGLILGMLWHCIVFLISYIPIRSYAGGYHASTQLRCYWLSNALILLVLLGIKLIPWNGYALLAISLFSAIIIFWLAPVEDLNKPLRQIEIVIYKRKARIIFVLLLCFSFLLWFAGRKEISVSIVMALQVVSVMLILGVMKNRSKEAKRC